MFKVNDNYQKLPGSYLFSTIAKKVSAYQAANPEKTLIRLGIGDVTQPLAPAIIDAMHGAVTEMGNAETFHGYAPDLGYEFLRTAIADNDYKARGCDISADEIFVSDGAKSDLGNILDIFSKDNKVLIPDPVYPVYVDTNVMDGRNIVFADANEQNGFLPLPDENTDADIVYICSPNNPTGAVYDKDGLKKWIAYAKEHKAVILFDAAYESFVTDPTLPRSIYEIDGAKECAVEFCSLSKTAGFTGTRCGYTVVPDELVFDGHSLNKFWLRRQTTKFNGVSYIVQRAAEAVFTDEGQKQIRANIDYYRENAKIITTAFDELGITYFGGKNSPYIWMKCPNGMDSWTFFDYLLKNAGVVGTPGAGFGENGEGFFRLTSFSNHENTQEAMKRFKALLA